LKSSINGEAKLHYIQEGVILLFQGLKIRIFSSRHASILKQFAIALELFNKKSLDYQLLVWLCEQLQASHLSGAKCIFSGAFAPELQTIFKPCICLLQQKLG
jgi:hypothetical protein